MPSAATSAGAAHKDRVRRLRAALGAIAPGGRVRLAKPTSNLFRHRAGSGTVDVADFTHVLAVDPVARTADVEGMVTYERLVAATLPHGLMPKVVPQLKTITIGGAVTGLGIESSSFRNGMPHESVLEMEILTGDGAVVVAAPEGEHSALFHGFPNSYGTLGYVLRLTIELEPVRPYVHVRHIRHRDSAAFFADMARVCDSGQADFVDGTVFGPDEMYLTVGTFTDTAPYTSDYTWLDIYYRSIQRRADDYLTVKDYLWRWDTDWFWCSRAFGVQHKAVRLLLGRRLLRSDVYWRIVAADRRHGLSARVDRLLGRPRQEAVIQDIEVPVDRAVEFLEFFHREIPINPVWVCPIKPADDRPWPLYGMDPDTLYVNFGFWSTVALEPGEVDGVHNRMIERVVARLGGRKSLYSASYHDEAEFWELYNGPAYRELKRRYDPQGRLLDLYDKCVRGR